MPTFSGEPDELKPFIKHARTLRSNLLTSALPPVLLHGDFHQDNVLASAQEQWVIIDPEGIVGNPLYDVAVYMRNPLTKITTAQHSKEIIVNRMHDFAALLGYTVQDIHAWTYLQTVTSAYWSIEDGLDATEHVAFLHLLDAIRCIGSLG